MAGLLTVRQGRKSGERGSALIMVMGVLILLAIVGIAFVTLMRIETHATRNFNEDAQARMLALQALNFALAHPTWTPPAGSDVDNDNDGVKESAWFTFPLTDVAADVHPRFAIMKKPFNGRVNVNYNGFYNKTPSTDPFPYNNTHQILNECATTAEVSLEKVIEAKIRTLITAGIPGFATADPAQAILVAREISLRICNYRYGQNDTTVSGDSAPNMPGVDGVDDTAFCDDYTLNQLDKNKIGAAPLNRTLSDDGDWSASPLFPPKWVYPNWRPDPSRDWVNEQGDGLVDRADSSTPPNPLESIDKPQDFLPDSYRAAGGCTWPGNDDHPFDNSDLNDILTNPPGPGSHLKAIVNDVCQSWVASHVSGYGGTYDYFDSLREVFTTSNSDYVGNMCPINHLNLLDPDPNYPPFLPANDPTGTRLAAAWATVQGDRAKFVDAMTKSLTDGGMDEPAAVNVSWQILANLIDYLDLHGDNPDGHGSYVDNHGYMHYLVKPEGWLDDPAHDTVIVNHQPDPGEPGTRTFYGTVRQPYLNEFWIYNRESDNFDNNGVANIDSTDPDENGKNGYYVELYNPYDNANHDPIYLYKDVSGGAVINWGIRVVNSAGQEQSIHYFYDAANPAQTWQTGVGWTNLGPSNPLSIEAGGYLIIENYDYKSENTQIKTAWSATGARGSRLLPDPSITSGAGTLHNTVVVNLNSSDQTVRLFRPGDTVQLIYSRDPRGTDPVRPAAFTVVVDSQPLPSNMSDTCPYFDSAGTAHPSGNQGTKYHFWPSFEREDPRVAVSLSDRAARLQPTALYKNPVTEKGGDKIRTTLGRVNDNGDIDDTDTPTGGTDVPDSSVFDGNYHFGDDIDNVPNPGDKSWLTRQNDPSYTPPNGTPRMARFDDLVEIPNDPKYKFANVGAMGNLLCVGPLPFTPTAQDPAIQGWSDPAAVDNNKSDYWLIKHSPYTAYPSLDSTEPNLVDMKKVDFLDAADAGRLWEPKGRARGIFDRFTTLCPWLDGLDNTGAWVTADDSNSDGGPSVGDQVVEDPNAQAYVYGRIDVNNSPAEVIAGLPYVTADGIFNTISGIFLTPATIVNSKPAGGYASRRDFINRIIAPALAVDSWLDPSGTQGAFGRDLEDNNIHDGATDVRRNSASYEWATLQRYPRTAWSIGRSMIPWQFALESNSPANGGDLVDEKSEMDYTVGALVNAISLQSQMPQQFTAAYRGPVTYYITVDLTNGKDVDGSLGSTPVWNGAGVQVLAEKRIVALVDTSRPSTDPKRITMFNWSVVGKSPEQ